MCTIDQLVFAESQCRRALDDMRHFAPGSRQRENLSKIHCRRVEKYDALLALAGDDLLIEHGSPAALLELKRRQES
jgi:hypothetical protein